jgi:hypothetical protein
VSDPVVNVPAPTAIVETPLVVGRGILVVPVTVMELLLTIVIVLLLAVPLSVRLPATVTGVFMVNVVAVVAVTIV